MDVIGPTHTATGFLLLESLPHTLWIGSYHYASSHLDFDSHSFDEPSPVILHLLVYQHTSLSLILKLDHAIFGEFLGGVYDGRNPNPSPPTYLFDASTLFDVFGEFVVWYQGSAGVKAWMDVYHTERRSSTGSIEDPGSRQGVTVVFTSSSICYRGGRTRATTTLELVVLFSSSTDAQILHRTIYNYSSSSYDAVYRWGVFDDREGGGIPSRDSWRAVIRRGT
ncbi:hypothetical protein BDQ12DRAFT_665479 [Crucibulum laeve]|uniref:Uncharacterized protein n=1 Tax=Crucibulum laeve TaxID=68775 RepID=A0A5C3M167_9AGAR|nr:hypothetical protein BDQ12DRAFT_665479 [Crucibulum laeve]